jgi:hypothetical protein
MLARVAILAPQQEQEYRTLCVLFLVEYGWSSVTEQVEDIPPIWKIWSLKSFTVRIPGSALVLSSSHPDKPMLIAESILQSVGLSPLLFEVSLILLRWYVENSISPGSLSCFGEKKITC